MARRRVNLSYRKERCLLSDALPYEVPVTFTNRHFYRFLLKHKVEFHDGKIRWRSGSRSLEATICILLGLPWRQAIQIPAANGVANGIQMRFSEYSLSGLGDGLDKPKQGMIPFRYSIQHSENDYRDLVVPHPQSQLRLAAFYDQYKETILHYCSLSPFSIRRPSRISTCIYHKDRTHYDMLAEGTQIVEQDNHEYEELKSFFVYKDYSNIYKFYESHRYHRCEKRYQKLLKLDISKCFASIYTHSLPWALLGKDAVKEQLKASKGTFGGVFDRLMQSMNYSETNGIIVGPEFSRVFAELILQSVDRRVAKKLRSEPRKLRNKIDFEAFRYVDDYFVFYNDEGDRSAIESELQFALKEFKLYLNAAKAVVYEKPIITEISRAKRRIANLLQESLVYRLEEIDAESADEKPLVKGSIYVNSRSLIVQFKTVIKECNVEYRDLLNYSLAIVENKCELILKRFQKADPHLRSGRQVVAALIAILEFVFFIYSVSPRVNTTIKLCRVLNGIVSFSKSSMVTYEQRHLVFKCIYDDILLVLRKNRSLEFAQVETLYLLIALSELGKDYWLDQGDLASYFNVPLKREPHIFGDCSNLNYFSFTVLLFYMRGKKRYQSLISSVEKSMLAKFRRRPSTRKDECELVLLFFDALSCPYITETTKRKLLKLYDINDPVLQDEMIGYSIGDQKHWFTTWRGFDFGKELDSKRGQEVY